MSRMMSWQVLAIALVLAFSALGSGPTPVRVALLRAAEADGSSVKLGDVATVTAGDEPTANFFRSLVVAEAPTGDEKVALTRQVIADALVRWRIDLTAVEFAGEPSVTVTARRGEIGRAVLMKAVSDFIMAHTTYATNDIEIEFTRVPAPFRVPSGEVELVVKPAVERALVGPVVFNITCIVERQVVQTTSVAARIRVYGSIVVTQRHLRRDEVISDADVELIRRELSRSLGQYIGSLDDVIGKRATRNLAAHTPITAASLDEPIVVRRGAFVTVVGRCGPIRVSARGKAMQDGRLGDVIELTNPASRRLLIGRVEGPDRICLLY